MRLPAYLDLRRLQGRIVALFLLLLLLVQAGGFFFVREAIQTRVEQQIAERLRNAESNLKTGLQVRARLDGLRARIAAEDKGFIDAVGMARVDEAGRATLEDALLNQAGRAQAALAAYRSEDFFVGTGPDALRLADAAQRLPEEANGLQLALAGDAIYQVGRTPLRAPGLSGSVFMAWSVGDDVLIELQRSINVEALLAVRRADGSFGKPVSTMEPEQAQQLLGASAGGKTVFQGEELRTRMVELPADGGRLIALLWTSYDFELKQFRNLQLSLLGLTLAGLVLFALGAVFTARRVSKPIQRLVRSAERLGGGDYETPVQALSDLTEVRELGHALENMRERIRSREAQVHRLAYWDGLTGLPNRAQFARRLQRRLQDDDAPLALFMLNLERFKPVNDALGRELGDALLRQVADRLRAFVGTEPGAAALLARLGGDEFALWVDGLDEAQAGALARRMLHALEQPLQLAEQTVDVGAGLGVALFPQHARDVDDLLSLAERAMHLAKRRQAGALVFQPSMDARSPASLSLLTELRQAVQGGELRLYLQPKLHLSSGKVTAAEALVRWQHPQRGLVPPGQFIPFAEQTGFIRQLTRWVLEAAATCAAQARSAGVPLRISVNLSTRDLLDAELPEKLMAMLARCHCESDGLCLEITESAIMDDPKQALATAMALHAAGFKLSIDDFGTGYSSLAYLKQLPVQELKIDQSFVFHMAQDEGDRKIVKSTIDLAHNLGLAVVAEGIEDATTLELLASMGCDEGQGYHIARPMPAEQLLQQLSARDG